MLLMCMRHLKKNEMRALAHVLRNITTCWIFQLSILFIFKIPPGLEQDQPLWILVHQIGHASVLGPGATW